MGPPIGIGGIIGILPGPPPGLLGMDGIDGLGGGVGKPGGGEMFGPTVVGGFEREGSAGGGSGGISGCLALLAGFARSTCTKVVLCG